MVDFRQQEGAPHRNWVCSDRDLCGTVSREDCVAMTMFDCTFYLLMDYPRINHTEVLYNKLLYISGYDDEEVSNLKST